MVPFGPRLSDWTIRVFHSPFTRNTSRVSHAMWQFCPLSIVGPRLSKMLRPVQRHILLRTRAAFPQVAIRHHRMPIELRQRLITVTLKACFHVTVLA